MNRKSHAIPVITPVDITVGDTPVDIAVVTPVQAEVIRVHIQVNIQAVITASIAVVEAVCTITVIIVLPGIGATEALILVADSPTTIY